ncbi:MAG: YdaU family protein [Gammaproteobacteria bacterium]|nr:YdaU family protein [Gammaproteobacteria bacterium]
MSLPYMPFFVGDYEGKTAHLTLEEDGAYNRLLRLCWRTPGCSIPDEDAWIQRKMRVDEDTMNNVVRPIISEFLKTGKGRLFSERQMEEFIKAKNKHKKRVAAGKKGGRPSKPLKNKETGETNASDLLKPSLSNHNHNHNHSKKVIVEETITQKKRGSRLSDDWFPKPEDEFLKPYNLTPDQLQNHFDSFRDYWMAKPGKDGVKLDWQATWRNWIRNSRQSRSKQNGRSTRSEINKALYEATTERSEHEPERTIRPGLEIIPASK